MDRDNLIETKENNKIKKFISCFSILVLFIGVFLVINNAGDTYAYSRYDCPTGWGFVAGVTDQYSKCQKEFEFSTYADLEDKTGETSAFNACKSQISTYVEYDYSGDEGNNFCYRPSSSSDYYLGTFYVEDYAGACYVCGETTVYNSESSLGECTSGGTWKKQEGVSKLNCKFYTITYYDEENTETSFNTSKHFYNTTATLIEKNKDGYNFDGWVIGKNCDSGDLITNNKRVVKSNTSITLCYTKITKKDYTAYFDANGGTGLSYSKDTCESEGSSCPVDEPSVSRSGYTHVGWSKNSNSTSCSYNVTADSSTPTYYACWSKNDYKVTFNMNGGILKRNDTITNKIVYKLGTINTSTYTAERNNDTFNGWSTSSDCSSPNKSYTNSNITKAMSLYACFTEVEDPKEPEPETPVAIKYNVKFNTLGGKLLVKGTETTERTFKLSSLYYKDYVAEKEGYTFKGWSLSKTCDKIGSSEKYYDPLRENKDLYACYNANITISKIDIINDKALPGAEFELKNSAGKLIDKWITTEEPHEIKDLPNGKYKLTETKVPEGYEKTNEYMEFEITSEDGVRLEELVIYNIPKNVVSISKQDITTKKELPGATLVLKDSSGKVIDKWKSEDKPRVIKGLKAGKYTLEETIAPEGYKLNKERITFEVKSDGKVEPVVMYNTPKEEKNPQTGSALLFVVYIIGAISLGYACYYYVMNVKKND